MAVHCKGKESNAGVEEPKNGDFQQPGERGIEFFYVMGTVERRVRFVLPSLLDRGGTEQAL